MSLNVTISLLSSAGNKINIDLDTTSFIHLGTVLTDVVKGLLDDYINTYYYDLDNESRSMIEDEAITIFNQIQKGKQPVIYETEMTKLPRLVDMKFSTSDLIKDNVFLTVEISYNDKDMTKYFLDRIVRGLAFGE